MVWPHTTCGTKGNGSSLKANDCASVVLPTVERVDSIGSCETLEESFGIAKSSGIRFRVGRMKGCEAHCQITMSKGEHIDVCSPPILVPIIGFLIHHSRYIYVC